MNSTFCALKKVHRSKQTFFGQMSIEKQPAIGSEHFTVGLFAMTQWSLSDIFVKNLSKLD